MKPFLHILALLLATLASACSSPAPVHFHSLMPATAPAVPASAATRAWSWEVTGVSVPAQVDVPELVLRLPDATLAVMERERWIAPLGDEVRAAVSEALAQRLGPPAGAAGPLYRVQLQVLRFDNTPGVDARLVLDWSLRDASSAAGVSLSCRGSFTEAASSGIPALTAAQRSNLARLAAVLGDALNVAASGRAPGCPG